MTVEELLNRAAMVEEAKRLVERCPDPSYPIPWLFLLKALEP